MELLFSLMGKFLQACAQLTMAKTFRSKTVLIPGFFSPSAVGENW